MDLIDTLGKGIGWSALWASLLIGRKQLTVIVINILSHQETVNLFGIFAPFLKLCNCPVTVIRSAFLHQIYEVIVPAPDNTGILHEGLHCEYNLGVAIAIIDILLRPKPLGSSKCRYSTSCRETCTSQYHDVFGFL